MARAVQQATPEPAPQELETVHSEAWTAVTSVDPNFAPPGNDDQEFFRRLVRAINDQVPQDYQMSPDADQWFGAAVIQPQGGQPIDAPDGFYEEGAEAEAEADAVDEGEPEAAVEAAPTNGQGSANGAARNPQPPALAAWREKEVARKAAQNTQPVVTPPRRGAAPAPAAAPPVVTPPRRGAVAPPAAPVTPPRRGAAPAPAPVAAPPRRGAAPAAPARPRRAAAQPAAESTQSMASLLRGFVITNPNCSAEQLMTYITSEGYTPKTSTVSGILTFAKSMIREIQEMGHWR